MSTISFDPAGGRLHTTMSYPPSHTSKAHDIGTDRRMSSANEGMHVSTTVVLRRLPRNTTNEAVRTMLLFAKDLQDTELISNEHPEDAGYVTALARFSSLTSATEVQAMLDGKPNTAGQANMIVEILSNSAIGSGRRNTIDPSATRGIKQPLSPQPQQQQKSSRFNGTFQSIEKMSPPLGSPPDHTNADGNSHMQNIFSPQSPGHAQDRARVTGKSMIGEDGGDDETGELLKDPVAYMKNDGPGYQTGSRQNTNSRLPISAFNALSLNTNMNVPATSGYTSPRSAIQAQTPNGAFSPGGHAYQNSTNQYLRHNYPPVNPADQNPPCNTLYVGNLPMDTSEDELKAMFSKQRGYKRLCFRTKQNGPMCFVEFEDVSFATKALNELYGVQLHNSVKGGIRLSFSKNPLGVRSGQPGSANPSTPHSPGSSMMNGMAPMSPGSFSAANGPPPGLSAPPGLNMNGPMSPSLMNGQFLSQNFQAGSSPMPGHRGVPIGHAYGGQQVNGGYPDHMMGR